MFTKSALSSFYNLAVCAFFVNAAAAGENVEKRQLDSSLVNSLNSVAASLATQSFSGESTTVTTTFGTQVETFTEIIGHPVSATGKPTSAASGSSGSGGSSPTDGSSPTSSPSGALGPHAVIFDAPLLGGLAVALASVSMGALVAL